MIRLFTIAGILLVVLASYLATYGQGPDFQMPPSSSLLKQFEAAGVVPAANDVVENEEVEHGIFEVPEEDEKQLEMAMSNMEGMDMSGMNMSGEGAMKMKLNPDGTMAIDADGNMIMEPVEQKSTMKMDVEMAADKDPAKPAMKMKLNPDGTMAVDADGNMIMEPVEQKSTMKMDGETAADKDPAKPAMKMKLNPDGTMAVDADGNMIMEPVEQESTMKMDGETAADKDPAKPAMKMKLNPDGTMAIDADGNMIMEPVEQESTMKMDGETATDKDPAKPAMKMKLNPDGTMAMDADGNMIMEPAESATKMANNKKDDDADHEEGDKSATEEMRGEEKEADHGANGAESGLKITEEGAFDREVNITMLEWSYSDLEVEVKSGERIKFNITNGGEIPHEFMFMTMPAMMAVSYRNTRADWSLLEHEALYEKSLVLPGGSFSFVAEIRKNGSWMFMCMLPYHMQMGMMGQIATPGMAMNMQM